jgi:hypothetical protein
MPKIVALKTDENGHVWADIGRIGTAQGCVMVLTEEEYNNSMTNATHKAIHILEAVIGNPAKYPELI